MTVGRRPFQKYSSRALAHPPKNHKPIAGEREIEFRITAETVLDVKRRKKPKGQIAKEQRLESDEFDFAPRSSIEEGLNDALHSDAPWGQRS